MNNISLMGRLTKTPELRRTTSGTSVASFTLAVDRGFKDSDGERQTDFIDCVAWKNTAEFISKYFIKGQMIAATGHLQTRNWQDKDGNNRKATEVVVDRAFFTGDKQKSDTEDIDRLRDFPNVDFADAGDDGDLPF